MSKTDLSTEDILHIAKLANLSLSDEEIEKYKSQLSETIKYVENLQELDTSNVQPTSHSVNVTNVYFEDGTENPRALSQQEALQNAKEQKGGAIKVVRVLGEE